MSGLGPAQKEGTLLGPLTEMGEVPLSGEYLLLIEPQRVPPHLAWVVDGAYFSLSVKGVELGKDLRTLLKVLERKKKEAVMLEVRLSSPEPTCRECFSLYSGHGPPEHSCLAPILDRCALTFGTVPTVHRLIETLEEKGRLHPPFLYHGEGELPERLFIPPYGKEDVRAHLQRYAQPGRHERE